MAQDTLKMRRAALAASIILLSTGLNALPAEAEEKRGWIEAMIEDSVSNDDLSIDLQGIEGLLGSTAEIEHIIISDRDGPWLEIDGAVLSWTRTALARKRLEVKELSAERISLIRKPRFPDRATEVSATPGITIPSLPDLPVAIEIGRISAPELLIGEDIAGEPLLLAIEGQARMADGAASIRLDLDQIGSKSGLDLAASYEGTTRELTLSLKAKDQSGGFVTRAIGLPGAPSLALTLEGSGPVTDFAARTTLATDGKDRVAGALRISPRETDGQLAFKADLGGDLRPMLPEDLHDFFGVDARLKAQGIRRADGRMNLDDFSISSRSMTLTGKATTDTGGAPIWAEISARVADPDGASVLLPFSEGKTQVTQADIGLKYAAPFMAGASQAWSVEGELTNLETSAGAFGFVSLSGNGPAPDLETILAGYMKLKAQDVTLNDPKLQQALGDTLGFGFDFDARKDGQVMLSNLDIQSQDQNISGTVNLSGMTAGGTPEVEANIQVKSDDFSPYSGFAGLPLFGHGTLDLSVAATPLSGTFDARIDGKTDRLSIGNPRLDPILKEATTISLSAQRDMEGVKLKTLALRNDMADINGSGVMRNEGGTLSLSGTLSDTSSLLKGASGSVKASLDITLQGKAAQITGSLKAPGSTQIAFDAKASLPTERESLSFAGSAAVSSKDISPYGALTGRNMFGAGDFDITYAGTPDKTYYEASIRGAAQSIRIGTSQVDRLMAGKTEVDLAVLVQDSDVTIQEMNASNPQLSLAGRGSMTSTDGALEAEVLLKDTSLILSEFPGKARLTARISPSLSGYAIDAQGTGPAGATAQVSGEISKDTTNLDLTLKGRAPAALVNPFIAPRRLGGELTLDLELDGVAALESLAGSVKLNEGSLSLPNLRLAARDINANAQIVSGQLDLDLAGAPTGGGRFAASGSIDLVNDLQTDLSVILDAVGASDPALYDTTLSGKVDIKGPLATGGKISGRVDVSETILRIPESIAGTYGPIPGLVHLRESALSRLARERAGFLESDDPAKKEDEAVTHDLDLRISAPARIYIRGRGLDAELGGDLRIEGNTGKPRPSGAFELRRGRLNILGQRLDLTEGVLRLSGSFNPEIRLVAGSITEIGTARIVIEGAASSPQLTLSSVPELPQDEVLSMLLFGKSVTDMTAIEGLKLANAVRTLTGGGGEGIIGKLRMNLGVDDLDISTSDSGEAQVGVGKYLADGVYANTSVTTSGETKIELNYEINEKLTARGKASSAGTASLGIFLERNY